MGVVFLFTGLIVGAIAAWFIAKSRFNKPSGIPLESLETNYVQKTFYDKLASENKGKTDEIISLNSRVSVFTERSQALEERIAEHKKEIAEIQERMKIEFKNISNEIFEEKSSKFIELNEKRVSDILTPLREKISEFEKKVDDTYKEESRERISMKKELEYIVKLNQQVSEDTVRLTNALKGDRRLQGEWGEIQLEQILSKAGLEKDIHYTKQETFKNDEGKSFRPDYVINLPEDKNLIIDSKVSLNAYEQFFNEEDETKKPAYLKLHLSSVNNHITGLSSKNYQSLYGINTPDYVLLFVPLESALYIALREDSRLFEKALERNIVLVSTSTLLATLRTISYIWKQDNQRKNVVEIARESGALYDKFVGFMTDMKNIGNRIEGLKMDYDDAMNKLYNSKLKGGTIIGRIERIKRLGADTNKVLPQSLFDGQEEEDQDEVES